MFLNIGFIFFMQNIISYHPVVECVLDMFCEIYSQINLQVNPLRHRTGTFL